MCTFTHLRFSATIVRTHSQPYSHSPGSRLSFPGQPMFDLCSRNRFFFSASSSSSSGCPANEAKESRPLLLLPLTEQIYPVVHDRTTSESFPVAKWTFPSLCCCSSSNAWLSLLDTGPAEGREEGRSKVHTQIGQK